VFVVLYFSIFHKLYFYFVFVFISLVLLSMFKLNEKKWNIVVAYFERGSKGIVSFWVFAVANCADFRSTYGSAAAGDSKR